METISAFFWLSVVVALFGVIKIFWGDRNGTGMIFALVGILGIITAILLNYLHSMKPISY